MMLQDLPNYNPGATLSWDEGALTGCSCDGGYFGPDCSLRRCPHGDDPATVCDQTQVLEQVQQVAFTFGMNLDSRTDDHITAVTAFVGEEFSLSFKTPTGRNLTTMAVTGTWGDMTLAQAPIDPSSLSVDGTNPVGTPDADAASRIELALESLPNYAVRDVTVSHNLRSATANLFVNNYRVTFHHLGDKQNSFGPQALLGCHIPTVCAAAGCQPRVRQPYAIAMFEGADPGAGTAVMVQLARPNIAGATMDATVTDGTSPWVTIHEDSVLSCPSTATGCPTSSSVRMMGGMNIVYDQARKEVWMRAFGSGDVEAPELHSHTSSGGQVPTILDGTWAYRPSIAKRGVLANGYKLAGSLSDATEGKMDISHLVPNSYLKFDPTVNAGTADLTASIFFQPAECTVTDVTMAGKPMTNPDVENIECSGRGECDRGNGKCECYEGYTGIQCGIVSTIV